VLNDVVRQGCRRRSLNSVDDGRRRDRRYRLGEVTLEFIRRQHTQDRLAGTAIGQPDRHPDVRVGPAKFLMALHLGRHNSVIGGFPPRKMLRDRRFDPETYSPLASSSLIEAKGWRTQVSWPLSAARWPCSSVVESDVYMQRRAKIDQPELVRTGGAEPWQALLEPEPLPCTETRTCGTRGSSRHPNVTVTILGGLSGSGTPTRATVLAPALDAL
jgi:hypothetical protein